MMDKDNCGCTPPPVIVPNGHWECAPIPDNCKPVELTDKLVKEMYEKNVNTEAFTTIEKAQLELLHNNVGGPNGAVKEIVAGKHIVVDATDPSKPIVSTDGVAGPKGDQGVKGDTGLQGVQGLQGVKGNDGISWHLAGRDTEANIMAKTGVPGDMWIVVEPTNTKDGHAIGWDPTLTPAGWKDMGQFKGDKGDTGTTGTTGPKGSKGDKGDQGVAGPKGPVGPKGAEGPKGPIGVTGAIGGQGIQGTKGDKGDAGKNGTGITVKGSKADETAIKTITGSAAGDMWIAKDTGHGWVSDGATPTVWTDAGDIQGPKGDIGTAGPQGVAGATGAVGATGPKGDTGINGSDGADGQQGIKGDIGLTGPKGNPGIPGPKGFEGPKGATGAQGPIGPQGNQGPQGVVGPKGDSGQDAVLTFATKQEVADGIVADKAIAPSTLPKPLTGYKNFVINGDFRIDQRNASTTNTSPYFVDMWLQSNAAQYSPGLFTTVVEPSLNNKTVGSITELTADFIRTALPIEITKGSPLTSVGTDLVLSFLAKVPVGSHVSIDIAYRDDTLYQDSNNLHPEMVVIADEVVIGEGTGAYKLYSYTFKDVKPNDTNICLLISIGAGTDDSVTAVNGFSITDCQLELGTTPTPFEIRPIGLELDLCKRYFERVERLYYMTGQATSKKNAILVLDYSEKRVKPTITPSVKTSFKVTATAGSTIFLATPIQVSSASKESCRLTAEVGGDSFLTGGAAILVNHTSSHFDISAEL